MALRQYLEGAGRLMLRVGKACPSEIAPHGDAFSIAFRFWIARGAIRCSKVSCVHVT